MGIISRRVLPVCGSLCFCCPALRARSRQPVRRYKKLLADIFPKNQNEPPNDRKIGKLTEYASKNALRIPKIGNTLEQRGYKELRNERYGTVRVVMRAFSRLLADCRDQMPLFATNVLGMIRALLEQVRADDMRILGCLTLVDFLNNQTDSTYMRNVDALMPNLCALGHEMGAEEARLPLRAAGLQALASMISYMGKQSQMSSLFEEIVEVILDNYEIDVADLGTDGRERVMGSSSQNWVQGVLKGESRNAVAAVKGAITRLYTATETHFLKDPAYLNRKEEQLPKVWSQICVQNLARLSKEATTMRRILEPMFHYFDSGGHWSSERGLSIAVLRDMQYRMETSGHEQLFLPVLVRHLDHKAVSDQPSTKAHIVEIIGNLARHSKVKLTVADIGGMSDLLKHLRNGIELNLKSPMASKQMMEDQQFLQTTLEECLADLVRRIISGDCMLPDLAVAFTGLLQKVGDAGPVLDIIASYLEKLSGNPLSARSTLDCLCLMARCVADIQDQSFTEQLFPEALLQQLVRAMMHPDAEARVWAHRILALLLIPSLAAASTSSEVDSAQTSNVSARTSSVFASASVLLQKLKKERETHFETGRSDPQSSTDKTEGTELKLFSPLRSVEEGLSAYFSPSRLFGFRASVDRSGEASPRQPASRRPSKSKDVELTAVRLSGHHAGLLLSVLWLQSSLPDNLPSNFEAIAHTYMLTLLFSRAKICGHSTIIRAFQLGFSLRRLALDSGNQLPPARRRSVLTLATAMIVFAGQAYNIPQISSPAKAPLRDAMDPFLDLSDDLRLKVAASPPSGRYAGEYGSVADDQDALRTLARISVGRDQTEEALVALISQSSAVFRESEGVLNAEQMLEPFSAEEIEGLGSFLSLESPSRLRSVSASHRHLSFDEMIACTSGALDDELIADNAAGDLPRLLAQVSISSLPQHAIGVPQLLEAALQTAGQVACVSFSAAPLSYSDMASQCEEFGFGSRKKMSSILRLEAESSSMRLTYTDSNQSPAVTRKGDPSHFHNVPLEHPAKDTEEPSTPLLKRNLLQDVQFSPAWLKQTSPEPWQVFRLPPASPYDNFLKAACY